MKIKEKYIYPFLDILLNGFNYGFHIYTSWYLIKESYATLNAYLALVSLFMVIGIALQSYNAKNYAGVQISGKELKLVNPVIIMGIPSLLLIFSAPLLVPFLKGDFISLLTISVLLISHSVLSSGRGIMQGQGSFLKLNLSFYIEVISKVIFLLVFMPRFPHVLTPLLSILFGYICSLLHLLFYIKKLKLKRIRLTNIKSFLKNNKIIIFIFSQFFIYSYFSMDMILVNGLHQEFAPIYAIIQKLGMIQFFVGSSLMAVFLPELADNRIDNVEFKIRWKRFLIILLVVLDLFPSFL
jgi:O-antigen/teichoic acid export membrane protein